MALISVSKWQGTGNDFVLLDARAAANLPYSDIARALCPRRFAIGADGLLVLRDPAAPSADVAMLVFNADGGEAEMCGNGIRCIARYLYDENSERAELTIETVAGLMQTTILTVDERPSVRVSMGEPRFIGAKDGKIDRELNLGSESAPAYAVSMGNPHVVVFASRETTGLDMDSLAATVAAWKAFAAEPNVEIARVRGDEIVMRVHERGTGETWACGTGACAVAAAAIVSGRAASPLTVTTKGGSVRVAWLGPGHPALLTGNAEFVFRTEVDLRLSPGG